MQTLGKDIVLVTGANKGIGLEIAVRLAEEGLRVLLGARNAALGEAAAARLREHALDVRVVQLDLSEPASIQAAAARIGEEFGRLDVLVNNAGIADPADGTPGTASLDAVRRVMEVNFFGTLAVTQALLPLLRKSAAGRIVNVSSGLGSLTWMGGLSEYGKFRVIGYAASKAALNMLTVQLAQELSGTSIKVNSADPGYTATDMNGHRGKQTVAQGAAEAIRLALLPPDGPTGGFFTSAGQTPW